MVLDTEYNELLDKYNELKEDYKSLLADSVKVCAEMDVISENNRFLKDMIVRMGGVK